ncbi:MAG: flagellar biosynthesis anti-sigma factor FlgM [Actinobacteria bacterium]|nr:flagellar biosynthesis anti-sigma factor FlgM [Actinomycetota bacterium]
MLSEASQGGEKSHMGSGMTRELGYAAPVGTETLEMVRGLMKPPEVREELVVPLKEAVAGNHYRVPVELVAQRIIESWTSCTLN